MGLVDDIAAARLSPAMARTFARGLRSVASADGASDEAESFAIRQLVGLDAAEEGSREPLESLWPHADLFIRACIWVALVDGNYNVEKARTVSQLAHRLGLSAHRLGELEGSVFRELRRAMARKVR